MQPRCNLFLYDNDTFGVLSYHNSPSEAGIILNDPTVTGICDLENGQEYYPVPGAKGERQIRSLVFPPARERIFYPSTLFYFYSACVQHFLYRRLCIFKILPVKFQYLLVSEAVQLILNFLP